MAFRLGVDVGGTFTDLLLINEDTGQTFRDKVPSTPDDPARAVVSGAQKICDEAGVPAGDIRYFMHGTTVATNAVLEHKVARVGLIVTEGYRHILQVARSLVPGGLAAWIVWPKPATLAPLECTIEAPERMDAHGEIVRPLDEDGLRANLKKLKEDENIEALTISLVNSYTNAAHEKRAAEVAAEIFPDLPITISTDILPEMQEYERTLATVANSAVRPAVARYVGNLKREIEDWGMTGKLNLLRSDGGLMSAAKSSEAPVNLLMSGPAGGVSGALWVARNAGFEDVLTVDMGGTSTDVALIEKGEPRLRRETEVGSLTVRASSLDIRTVGAGGGSIAHVPELTGALRVGPESAGAVPGPVAYGKGGTLPTVTDANVVLGYLPEALLGGSFKLDREGAKKSVQTIADALGIGLMEAAAGIIALVNENMFGALRLVSVQQGYDPRDFALMPFGGAGPLHGNALGALMGSWPVLVPPSPGVLCAYGDATTRLRVETQRSFNTTAPKTNDAAIATVLEEIAAQVTNELAAEDVDPATQTVQFEADVRYMGQAFEVPLAVTLEDFKTGSGLKALCDAFDAEHKRLFTFNLDVAHEIVNLRATALGPSPALAPSALEKGSGDPSAARIADHDMWMNGRAVTGGLYDRSKLKAGDVIVGPAVISEMDSTTLLLEGHVAKVDDFANLLITPA